jgi:thymidine phosphorylase
MVRAEEIIRRKRDGQALSEEHIAAFVSGIADGDVTDAQIAAFTMATWFKGMEEVETVHLTLAMRDSGTVLDWPDIDGPVLDKHSTGGVGDLVSLVLGPVVAACGGYVPMISGRGLGHTGGTLDKLESIPGFRTRLDIDRFRGLVRELGVAIVGQSSALAPADRRIYAVRDVTATVSSPPLMISSILSKKLAEGLDALVLDIKFGSGAFSPNVESASRLARQMASVASNAGVSCNALLTDMNEPLAASAGNALEIAETVAFLSGKLRQPRLYEVVTGLSAELLWLGELADSRASALRRVGQCLDGGQAAERFAAMVAAQGGPADLLEKPEKHLAVASVVRPVEAEYDGFIASVDTKAVGDTVVALGGGRRRVEDRIDPAVGLSRLKSVGEPVVRGEPLARVHAASEDAWQTAAAALRRAYRVTNEAPAEKPVVHSTVEGVTEQ